MATMPRRRKAHFNEEHCRQLLQRSGVALIVSHGLEEEVEIVNDTFTRLFGYTMEDIPDVAHWWPLAYPDEAYREAVKAEWQTRVAKAIANQSAIESMEAKVRCKDGSERYIEFHFSSVGDTNLVSFVDLTEQKMTEEALRNSEQKFLKAFRRSPVAITLSRVRDQRFIEVNDTFELLTGYRRDEVIERTVSEIGLWVDPSQREELRKRLVSEGSLHDLELGFRTKSGGILTCLVAAELIEVGQEACILSVASDITDRKEAEAALAEMSRKLIAAQEQERARIGRELHDDINQRLGMLAIELEKLQDNPVEVISRAKELVNRTIEIASDVQALSHELHASKLEYLGAIRGLKSWCKEFGQRQGLKIAFTSKVSSVLSHDIGTCLFRVLQEALHNAVKHSGAKRITVQLRDDSNEVSLIIHDSGKGFDVTAAMQGQGLGLTSMHERIRLLNGTITIQSTKRGGTTIHARIPFSAELDSERAAG